MAGEEGGAGPSVGHEDLLASVDASQHPLRLEVLFRSSRHAVNNLPSHYRRCSSSRIDGQVCPLVVSATRTSGRASQQERDVEPGCAVVGPRCWCRPVLLRVVVPVRRHRRRPGGSAPVRVRAMAARRLLPGPDLPQGRAPTVTCPAGRTGTRRPGRRPRRGGGRGSCRARGRIATRRPDRPAG